MIYRNTLNMKDWILCLDKIPKASILKRDRYFEEIEKAEVAMNLSCRYSNKWNN